TNAYTGSVSIREWRALGLSVFALAATRRRHPRLRARSRPRCFPPKADHDGYAREYLLSAGAPGRRLNTRRRRGRSATLRTEAGRLIRREVAKTRLGRPSGRFT